MSSLSRERDAFEARLRQLHLEWLDQKEVERLWQSRMKQIDLTNRLIAEHDPAAESALQLDMGKGTRT